MFDSLNVCRNPSRAELLFNKNVHVVLKGATGNDGSACRVRSAAVIRISASDADKGTAATKSVMEVLSSGLAYRTRGAKPAWAAACMQAKWRVMSPGRVLIRNRYADPRTTM